MQITLPALEHLQQAADGLLMPSETDAPFAPFFWVHEKAEDLTPKRVRELAGAGADTSIESVSLRSFFRHATTEEEWHSAEEAARVQKFKALVKAIKNTLDEPRVWRVGETEIECFIAGNIAGIGGGARAPRENGKDENGKDENGKDENDQVEGLRSGVGGLKTRIVET